MFKDIQLVWANGKQFIPDLRKAKVPAPFRGRPVLSEVTDLKELDTLVELCPTKAINKAPFSIDLGKCIFCGECEFASKQKIKFTNDHLLATNSREKLIIAQGQELPIQLDETKIRTEIRKLFKGSLKLRQVCAGGDGSNEMELGACGNVNFDMARFGIEFVASPRHADGIVITGPITQNMARALEICYQALAHPKLIILAGTDAISGGIFSDSLAINREFLNTYKVDLYVPGNPIHPLTFINGILDLLDIH